MPNTKSQKIDLYRKKINLLCSAICDNRFIEMSETYKESQINECVDYLFHLKFTLQGGGK